MRKKDRKLIFLLLVLILILIVFISIFSKLVKKENTEEKNKNNYKDESFSVSYEKVGKYEPSVINDEYSKLNHSDIKAIDTTIDLILSKINEKQYLELYYMMENEYRDIFFENEESFKEFFDTSFRDSNYKCFSYRIESNACYIIVSNASELDENNYIEIKIYNFRNPQEALIYFHNIKQIIWAHNFKYVSKVQVNMKYIVEYDDEISVFFEVVNGNNENVSVNIENLKLITMANNRENKAKATGKFSLKQKETKLIEIKCEKSNVLTYLPEFVEYEISVNGKSETIKTTILYKDII